MPDDHPALVFPPGVRDPFRSSVGVLPEGDQHGAIINDTGLPDQVVTEAVETYFEENASMLGVNLGNTFQTYSTQAQGSLLSRRAFRTPGNVFEEICLARDLAERDDDVAATLGAIMAVAYSDGMRHTHKDEVVIALYNEVAKHASLDSAFHEMHREWLIAGQVTTVAPFVRNDFQFTPDGADRQRTRTITAPLIGVLPAELIRVVGNDMFGTGTLAYLPANGTQERWLMEYFNERTTAPRKAEMRTEDPILAAMMIGQIRAEPDDHALFYDEGIDPIHGQWLYELNPRMVARTTMAKGAWKYPRPPMTRNFALLEAKRLLNLMDFSLLQGGANFLVVAKKGSDARPALPDEITNLREQVRRASRTGVMIGDHRLTIDIITPNLTELLNPEKRRLLGRKLATALLRLPDYADPDAGGGSQAVLADVEILSRVISDDRRFMRRHIEDHVYDQVEQRNRNIDGSASIWFPKIILQGLQYFTDLILKLGDRGNLSRKSVVEAAGFDYEAELEQRRREKAAGDDRTLTPPPVPFSSPSMGPQDNNPGRPRGTSPDNGQPNSPQGPGPDPHAPRRTLTRNPGETVRAMYDDDLEVGYRIGEITYAVLEEYVDTKKDGRLTAFEQKALRMIDSEDGDPGTFREGPLAIVPVNVDADLDDYRVVRLAQGVSMIVGYRDDDRAIMARAFCFRAPEFGDLDAEERALQWGYPRPALLAAGG